jgi:transcriptional regulator with XRE-family HTH domain
MFTRRQKKPEIDLALATRLFKDCFTKETVAANYLDLADKCSVDSKTAERWLNGKQQPDSRNLALLAKALGCTVGQLLGNDAHPLREAVRADRFLERREETAEKKNEEDSKVLLSLKITETSSKLKVTVEGDKESYSKDLPVSLVELFVNCLANVGIATEKEKIVHLNTEFGSIILTFEMPAEWAKALELAARNGELREFGITDVQAVDDTQKMDVSDQRKEGENTPSDEFRLNPVEGKVHPNADDSVETKSTDEGSEKPPAMSQDDFSTDSAPKPISYNLLNDPKNASIARKILEEERASLYPEDGYCEVRISFENLACYVRYRHDVIKILRNVVTQFPVGIAPDSGLPIIPFRYVLGVILNGKDAKQFVSALYREKKGRMGILGITIRSRSSFESSELLFEDMHKLEQWQS